MVGSGDEAVFRDGGMLLDVLSGAGVVEVVGGVDDGSAEDGGAEEGVSDGVDEGGEPLEVDERLVMLVVTGQSEYDTNSCRAVICSNNLVW